MSELSRVEFIKRNFGRKNMLDIRATIGKLTMPTEEEGRPSFIASDVFKTWGAPDLKQKAAFYQIGTEIKHMVKLSMLEMTECVEANWKGHGNRYARLEESALSSKGWELLEKEALTVVELFPGAQEHKVWEEFVISPAPEG